MKLAMELFYDSEVGQWGYAVPVLSIVGTGCKTREEAERLGMDAIRFVIDADAPSPSEPSDIVMFDVEIKPAAQAS